MLIVVDSQPGRPAAIGSVYAAHAADFGRNVDGRIALAGRGLAKADVVGFLNIRQFSKAQPGVGRMPQAVNAIPLGAARQPDVPFAARYGLDTTDRGFRRQSR